VGVSVVHRIQTVLNNWLSPLKRSLTMKYVSAAESQKMDDELMGDVVGYSTEQLMELAGLSVATAVHREFGVQQYSSVLVISGPGNNGGDGLIAARHLVHFGYKPHIYYPKRVDKPHMKNLVKQCQAYHIEFLDALPNSTREIEDKYQIIVDAIFGYSFKGDIRPPFNGIIEILKAIKIPIASVDIPSGWDVEQGNINNTGFNPALLVSLGSPKLGVKDFKGLHYLGGRFVPPSLDEKYQLQLPQYPGSDVVVKL